MRNRMLIILLYTIIGYVIVLISTMIGMDIFKQYTGVIIGLCLMLFAIIIHMIGSTTRFFYPLAYSINSIGIGFTISTYYTYLHKTISIETLILCSLIGIAVVIIYQVITLINTMELSLVGFTILFAGLLYSISIVLWVQYKEPFYSALFFYQHIALFMIIATSLSRKNPTDTHKIISICSFGELLVVGSIVLIIISEGELLEGVGEGIGNSFVGGGKQKKQPK